MAAGGPLTDDIFKCALKPVTTSDYTTTLTTPQLDALKAALRFGAKTLSSQQCARGSQRAMPGFVSGTREVARRLCHGNHSVEPS